MPAESEVVNCTLDSIVGAIKLHLAKEERSQLQSAKQIFLGWLWRVDPSQPIFALTNESTDQNANTEGSDDNQVFDAKVDMSITELRAMLKLEQYTPYNFVFPSLRENFELNNDDKTVAQQLIRLADDYQDSLEPETVQQIVDYLNGDKGMPFKTEWLSYLTDVLIDNLSSEEDEKMELSTEITYLRDYLMQTIDQAEET